MKIEKELQKKEMSYVTGGATTLSPTITQIYRDKIFYVNGRSILSEGKEYFSHCKTKITCMSIAEEKISVGDCAGNIFLLSLEETILFQEKLSLVPLSIRHTGNLLFCATNKEIRIYLINEHTLKHKEKTDHIIVDMQVIREKEKIFCICATYEGKLVIFRVNGETGFFTKEAESISYKSEARTVSVKKSVSETIRKKEENQSFSTEDHVRSACELEIEIVLSLSSGKLVVFSYTPETLVLRKKEIISGHRYSCSSSQMFIGAENAKYIISSSDDGTAALWKQESEWVCKKRYGSSGGPSLIASLVDSKENIYFQTQSGSIFQASSQHLLVSGHTQKINSIDVKNSLILTASEDKTVRIFKVSNNQIKEVFRPLTGGHPISSALFLDDGTISIAADENILRIYKETNLFREALSLLPKNLSFTATHQELSLTTVPMNPSEEEQETIKKNHLTEVGLSSNPFLEHHKAYGYPFEIKTMAYIKNTALLLCCKSSQKEFSSLLVTDLSYKIIQRIQVHTLNIKKIVISPSQKYVVTIGRDRRIALFKIQKDPNNLIALLDSRIDHLREIFSVTFSKKDDTLFTSSKDKRILHYIIENEKLVIKKELTTNEEVRALAYHTSLILGKESGKIETQNTELFCHNSPISQLFVSLINNKPSLISATEDGALSLVSL
ncbi:elongator complex protein 2 [Nematocida sp. LUAm3]|nr:elongator complex protein 2 [Nematocida sp. LUAm3]KAI5174532.1 elongator complex protein 2 [Nematocida sp. LUAm2]KAI5178062.1 elongator complex protein 2 [Nematocida sp. LUAm1]